MDIINFCNPEIRILKHMNISLDRIEREAGRFIGMYLPNGYRLETHYDVFGFVNLNKDKKFLTFGAAHCNNREEATGCCKGHQPSDIHAPRDYSVVAESSEQFWEIKNTHFGKLEPVCAKHLREGDYITLEHPETKEKIKCVVTFRHSYTSDCTSGVALVMQREKPNGKIQYFI